MLSYLRIFGIFKTCDELDEGKHHECYESSKFTKSKAEELLNEISMLRGSK